MLIKCPECQKEISENAKTCPNCGCKIKKPMTKKQFKILTIAIIVIIFGSCIGFGVYQNIQHKKEVQQKTQELKRNYDQLNRDINNFNSNN